ncbi:MAG: LuxR C-terminal-related transcriptional regulator, partial [Dehalococcoidales bacterium]|nr:LuxR C-terminal-related transcriptional regulator [Dehalococcoidales bacterium]
GNIARSAPLDSGETLNYRDIEILRLLATGMSNKDIADKLGLTLRTIKNYMVSLFGKMHVSSRTEAVITALKSGVISFDEVE